MWLIRTNSDDLDTEERQRLDWLLAQSAPLKQAYTLQRELTQIFETARSKADGLRRMGFWRIRVVKSGLRCFDPFLTLLDMWLDLIVTYVIDHQTSGVSVQGVGSNSGAGAPVWVAVTAFVRKFHTWRPC